MPPNARPWKSTCYDCSRVIRISSRVEETPPVDFPMAADPDDLEDDGIRSEVGSLVSDKSFENEGPTSDG